MKPLALRDINPLIVAQFKKVMMPQPVQPFSNIICRTYHYSVHTTLICFCLLVIFSDLDLTPFQCVCQTKYFAVYQQWFPTTHYWSEAITRILPSTTITGVTVIMCKVGLTSTWTLKKPFQIEFDTTLTAVMNKMLVLFQITHIVGCCSRINNEHSNSGVQFCVIIST